MTSNARILFLDIETSPNIGYTWGKYEQNVIEYVQEWYVLCFAWKWLDEKVHASAQRDFSSYKKDMTDDYNVMVVLWNLLDKADIVVVHNGARFDLPKINARFIYHGLTPPSPYKVVDTLKVSRKYFKFDSNKLDDIGKYLKVGRKLETGGFELWKGCMAGDEKAWDKMVKYNKQDVVLLEEVYKKFRPWIVGHPNLNVINNRLTNCPNCGSEHLQSHGFSFSQTAKKRRYQCQDCGAWSHGANEKPDKVIR